MADVVLGGGGVSGHRGGRAKECDGWEGVAVRGSGGLRCIGVRVCFCCRLLLWSAAWDTRGGECRGAEDGKKGAARGWEDGKKGAARKDGG